MRVAFSSRALSVTLSVVLAGFLMASIMAAEHGQPAPENAADQSAPAQPDAVEASLNDKPVTVASVALPPPPEKLISTPEPAVFDPVAKESIEAPPAVTVEPLQASTPPPTPKIPDQFTPLQPKAPAVVSVDTPEIVPLEPTRATETPVQPAAPPRQEIAAPQPTATNLTAIADAVDAEPPSPDPAASMPAPALVKNGRALLRILEHGSGPMVEIAWPVEAAERRRLFERFQSCYGMRLALMDTDGKLFTANGERGQPWDLNLDRYSGFVRQSDHGLTRDERRSIRAIDQFHRGIATTAPVRIFPRSVDSLLLGGLRQLIGDGYGRMATIHATYRLAGGRVLVETIEADGRSIAGAIDLSTTAVSSCRNSGAT